MASEEREFEDCDEESFVSGTTSGRHVVLRNPNFKTPSGPPQKLINLNNSIRSQTAQKVPLMTATPIRGPNRFLKVLAPPPESFDENDEELQISDETDDDGGEYLKDAFEPETPIPSNRQNSASIILAEHLELSPIPALGSAEKRQKCTPKTTESRIESIKNVNKTNVGSPRAQNTPRIAQNSKAQNSTPKVAESGNKSVKSASKANLGTPKIIAKTPSNVQNQSFKNVNESYTRRQETPKAALDTSKSNPAVKKLSLARKKLSLGTNSPLLMLSTSTENEENFNISEMDDSPFFKVPLPPKKIVSKKPFVIRRGATIPEDSVKRSQVSSPQKQPIASTSKSFKKSSPQKKPIVSREKSPDIPKTDNVPETDDIDDAEVPEADDIIEEEIPETDVIEEEDIPEKDENVIESENKIPSPEKKGKGKVKSTKAKDVKNPVIDPDAEIENLYDTARYVTNWVPKMKGKKMIVEGDLLDFE